MSRKSIEALHGKINTSENQFDNITTIVICISSYSEVWNRFRAHLYRRNCNNVSCNKQPKEIINTLKAHDYYTIQKKKKLIREKNKINQLTPETPKPPTPRLTGFLQIYI